jgi:GcrA cell cycle regulator
MWTEQAIETLRKLALEGRSASSIAAALGARSRSAVIGKACRIGIKLNGGGTRATREGGRTERPPGETPRRRSIPRDRALVPAVAREQKREHSSVFAAAEVGEMRRVGLLEIGVIQCRWPLGDPTEDDFAYCGLEVAKGHAYCAGHCRMAYRRPYGQAARSNWRPSAPEWR